LRLQQLGRAVLPLNQSLLDVTIENNNKNFCFYTRFYWRSHSISLNLLSCHDYYTSSITFCRTGNNP
jgi:hypothetical protein